MHVEEVLADVAPADRCACLEQPKAAVSSKPLAVTEQNFGAEVLEAGLPVLVDLWAPWCGPCRSIAPILDDLAAKYAGRVKVVKINVDDEPGLAEAFRVQSIPMLAVLKGDTVVDAQVGFGGRAAVEQLFERAIQDEAP
jgi:thioredoxin